METGIAFGLTSANVRTFRDLATKAHALELMTRKMPAFHHEIVRRVPNRTTFNTVDCDKKNQDTRSSRDKRSEGKESWNQSRDRYGGKRLRMLDSHEVFEFDKEDVVSMM